MGISIMILTTAALSGFAYTGWKLAENKGSISQTYSSIKEDLTSLLR